VLLTTYLSLVVGELVPKRIALNYSERVAIFIAPMMLMLSQIATPIVWFLSKSTELVTRILGIQDSEASMTDMEIIAMVREGVDTGAFDPSEHYMVRGVLELDDITIREVMTPRIDMISLNLQDNIEESLAKIILEPLTVYPVYDGDIDNVIGVVHAEDILKQLLENKTVDLKSLVRETIFIPETAIVANVLKEFRQPATKVILVIDEYGGIEGIVNENDIIGEILGHLDIDDRNPIQREDGSWLFDGSYPIDDMQKYLPEFGDFMDEGGRHTTLAGFILTKLGRIPKTGDKVTWNLLSVNRV
jgi:putative hemolysin